VLTAQRAARAAAVLFVVTAALFVIGVSTEPGHNESTEATETTAARSEGAEATEPEGAHDEGSDETSESGEEPHSEGTGEDETVLGIDVESRVNVTLAVIVSLALAIGLWFRPVRPVAITAVVFAVLFAVLDIAEVIHQLDDDQTGAAALAAVIAAGHVLAAGASGVVARGRTVSEV
jgi:hypothetical protein